LGGDKPFVFNLEAVLDVAFTAMMGIDVSKSESEKALHHAYEEAKITSGGAPPLATTLDNKPCNHSPDAQAALEDTILLAPHRAVGRPRPRWKEPSAYSNRTCPRWSSPARPRRRWPPVFSAS